MNSGAVEQCEVGCCVVVCIDSCFVDVVFCDGLGSLGRLGCSWIL